MNMLKRTEKGFTLIEVLASIVILSIILLGVMNLFVHTNKAAVTNSDRLVAINLGRTIVERIKINPDEYFDLSKPNEYQLKNGFEYTLHECEPTNCSDLYTIHVNDKDYELKVYVSQNEEEKKLNLINILVTVELPEQSVKHQVEGYVSYANKDSE